MSSIYVDSNETQQAVLGGGYLQNFISSGSVEKGFCEVTDKRVYFKGKCYYKTGNNYKSSKEERIIDLKDITGTGFVISKFWVLKFTTILFAILAILMTILGVISQPETNLPNIMIYFGAHVVCVVLFVLYLGLKQRLFEISFAGGKIAFKASNYSETEIQQFQKDLRLAKDRYEGASPITQPINSSNAEELKKYKELLDSGIISAEEFEHAKKKILGL